MSFLLLTPNLSKTLLIALNPREIPARPGVSMSLWWIGRCVCHTLLQPKCPGGKRKSTWTYLVQTRPKNTVKLQCQAMKWSEGNTFLGGGGGGKFAPKVLSLRPSRKTPDVPFRSLVGMESLSEGRGNTVYNCRPMRKAREGCDHRWFIKQAFLHFTHTVDFEGDRFFFQWPKCW